MKTLLVICVFAPRPNVHQRLVVFTIRSVNIVLNMKLSLTVTKIPATQIVSLYGVSVKFADFSVIYIAMKAWREHKTMIFIPAIKLTRTQPAKLEIIHINLLDDAELHCS